MIDRVAAVFLAGGALFGAVLFSELDSGDPGAPPVATPAPAAEQTRPALRLQSPRVDDLVATTLGRPLFSATRRPAERAAADRPADPELTNVRLTGIVIEPDRHIAIFAVPGAKPLVRSEGETVNEWRLDSIAPREVTVTGPAGTTTLEPKADPNLVRTAQPAQPAPAGRLGAAPAQPVATGARPPFPAAAAPQPKPPALAMPQVRSPKLQPNPARPMNPTRPPQ